MGERVAITGIAASTCLGLGVSSVFRRLAHGMTAGAASPSTSPSRPSGCTSHQTLLPLPHTQSALMRKTRTDHRLTQHLLAAVNHDLSPYLNRLTHEARNQCGVVIGNNAGHVPPYHALYQTATQAGASSVNPVQFPTTMPNYTAAQLSRGFALKGPNTTTSSGFMSSLEAIAYAAMQLQQQRASLFLAGGLDDLNPHNLAWFEQHIGGSPTGVARPLCPRRDGAMAAEGVGVLQLEPLAHTRYQNQKILGEILGYSTVVDNGSGRDEGFQVRVAASIHQALLMAHLTPDDIDAVFPSASGSVRGDALEADILQDVFKQRLATISVYPIKSILGECFGASGVLQCLAAVYALGRPIPVGSKTPHAVTKGLKGSRLPNAIQPCRCALIYSYGPDRTFAAVIIGQASL